MTKLPKKTIIAARPDECEGCFEATVLRPYLVTIRTAQGSAKELCWYCDECAKLGNDLDLRLKIELVEGL